MYLIVRHCAINLVYAYISDATLERLDISDQLPEQQLGKYWFDVH